MRPYISFVRRLGGLVLLCLAATAWAGPGDGFNIASWVFSPYVELNFTHDSNVYKDLTNVVEDVYYEPEVGLRFSSSSQTNCVSFWGDLFYSDRQYDTETNRDFETYGDSLTLRIGNGKRSLLELIQTYRHIDDNDRHAADIESSPLAAEMVEDSNTLDLERDVHQFGALFSRRMTDKLELGFSYRYSGVAYENETHDRLDPKDLGVPPGLDLDGHVWQLNGSLALTDKTDAYLALREGIQYQEYIDHPAEMTALRLGMKTHETEKVLYNANVGMERYERPPEAGGEESVNFNYNVSADWFITEKLTFRCGSYNGTQFSSFYEGNGMEYISGWAGLGYRWRPSTTFGLRGIYREDDYLDPVTHEGVTQDRFDKRFEGHARIDYIAPGGFLRLYLEGVYDEVDSNFDFIDYVDERIMLGAIVRY